jgi:hypothetical protein
MLSEQNCSICHDWRFARYLDQRGRIDSVLAELSNVAQNCRR